MDMSTHRQRECRYIILVTTTTITTPTPTKEHVNPPAEREHLCSYPLKDSCINALVKLYKSQDTHLCHHFYPLSTILTASTIRDSPQQQETMDSRWTRCLNTILPLPSEPLVEKPNLIWSRLHQEKTIRLLDSVLTFSFCITGGE